MHPNEFLVVILESVAHAAWPTLRARLVRWASRLLPDIPRLEGYWVAEFDNPTRGRTSRRLAIDASLQQFGRQVTGTGHVQGMPGDLFRFRGTIKRNVLFGNFAREDAQVLAGTGTFVLKVMADSRRLTGQCMWYDALLDGVWVSAYDWRWSKLGVGE